MKTLILTAFFISQLVGPSLAGTSELPEIPVSKLGVSRALAIFQKQMKHSTNYAVVAIDWCKASEFHPRVGGGRWFTGLDDPNEYSWFVTYLYKDKQQDKLLKELGRKKQQFNSASVIRIKDDGTRGVFFAAQ